MIINSMYIDKIRKSVLRHTTPILSHITFVNFKSTCNYIIFPLLLFGLIRQWIVICGKSQYIRIIR